MTMQYFNDASGTVHGFDDEDPAQAKLMASLAADWTNITGAWPPPATAAEQWAAYQAQARDTCDCCRG